MEEWNRLDWLDDSTYPADDGLYIIFVNSSPNCDDCEGYGGSYCGRNARREEFMQIITFYKEGQKFIHENGFLYSHEIEAWIGPIDIPKYEGVQIP